VAHAEIHALLSQICDRYLGEFAEDQAAFATLGEEPNAASAKNSELRPKSRPDQLRRWFMTPEAQLVRELEAVFLAPDAAPRLEEPLRYPDALALIADNIQQRVITIPAYLRRLDASGKYTDPPLPSG
jgi:hypothetical protein